MGVLSEVRRSRFLELVHRSNVHRDIEELLRPKPGGAPRQLRADVFLAGLLCTIAEKKTVALTLLHELFTRDLARSFQIALGIRVGGKPITIRQVRYLLEAIEKKLAFTGDRAPDLSEVDRAERRQALNNVFDRLLDATMPTHLPPPGAYAVDDSGIDSAARGKRRTQQPSAGTGSGETREEPTDGEMSDEDIAQVVKEIGRSYDPDARWGYRTRTYDNRTNKLFGYKLVSFTRLAPTASKVDLPLLVERIAFIPANESPVEPAMAIVDRLLAEGKPLSEIADDRGFSYGVAENWAIQLREKGIEQILDLHQNDRGVRDFEGVKMIDGWPHCPSTPDHLEVIVRPARLSVPALKKNATPLEAAEHAERQKALDEFRALIAERESWAFRRAAGPDRRGKEHYECPAQAGKRKCANCPIYQFLPEETPVVENPPEKASAPSVSCGPGPPAPATGPTRSLGKTPKTTASRRSTPAPRTPPPGHP